MPLWIILIANGLLSILFIVRVKDKQQRIFGLFFLMLPVLGFLFYFIPKIGFQWSQKTNLYDVSNVKLKINEETFSQKPDVQKEMNIVSFNEVMQIGRKEEKRSLLLNVLQDDLVDNAAFIRSALGDSDSETTHYAASATMQIYTKLRSVIQALETSFQLDPNNTTVMLELLTAISNYIQSGVLTKRDHDFYCNKYIRTFNQLNAIDPEVLTSENYLNQVDFQFSSLAIHESIETALKARDRFDLEEVHLKVLELYYKTGNQRQFNEAFETFKHSKLTVSNKGLELIRFWSKRSV